MKNVTIALDEDVLRASREYARRHKTSLNALIRDLLEHTTMPQADGWLDECFALMDETQADSGGQRWTRDELYRE